MAREEKERLKSLVPIILRATLVCWVSPKQCFVYSAGLICYPNAGCWLESYLDGRSQFLRVCDAVAAVVL